MARMPAVFGILHVHALCPCPRPSPAVLAVFHIDVSMLSCAPCRAPLVAAENLVLRQCCHRRAALHRHHRCLPGPHAQSDCEEGLYVTVLPLSICSHA